MSERVTCTCGAVLLEDVTARGIKLVGSDEYIVFRRATDHVICSSCLKSYSIRDLISRVEEREVIAHLERMADEAQP